MRFITFSEGAGLRRSPGVLLDDLSTVVDLSHHYATLQDLIDAGDAGRSKAESVVASRAGRLRLADVELLAPLPEPRQFRDCMFYEDHVRQAIAEDHRRSGNSGAPPPIRPEEHPSEPQSLMLNTHSDF